jgi:hypothetical protein
MTENQPEQETLAWFADVVRRKPVHQPKKPTKSVGFIIKCRDAAACSVKISCF